MEPGREVDDAITAERRDPADRAGDETDPERIVEQSVAVVFGLVEHVRASTTPSDFSKL